MSKKWWGILAIAVVVILILSGIFMLWNDPIAKMKVIKQISPNTITEGNLPEEWGENFDPRLNPATFMVNGKSDTENNLELTYAFPPSKAGEKFRSSLVCEQGLVTRTQNQKKGEDVSIQEAISLMTLENDPVMITAYCGDLFCSTIVGRCDIYLSGKSK